MAKILIKNLLLRTQVGFNDHETGKKQDLLLNIKISYDTKGEEVTDNPEMALNYRDVCKSIIDVVESNNFNLIETVAQRALYVILENKRVKRAVVQVDKPHALRFSESVSVKLKGENKK